MSDKPTCATCKHWEGDSRLHAPCKHAAFTTDLYDATVFVEHIQAEMLDKAWEIAELREFTNAAHDVRILTGPSFGCIHHEPKEAAG